MFGRDRSAEPSVRTHRWHCLAGGGGDVPQHGTEDQVVERPEQPPVRLPEQPGRLEDGPLAVDRAARSAWPDGELQPRLPWQLHLRSQPEQRAGYHLLDPPEVHGVAGPHVIRITPAPAQADAADGTVSETANRPGGRERIPAMFSADAFNRAPQGLRRCADPPDPVIEIQRAT